MPERHHRGRVPGRPVTGSPPKDVFGVRTPSRSDSGFRETPSEIFDLPSSVKRSQKHETYERLNRSTSTVVPNSEHWRPLCRTRCRPGRHRCRPLRFLVYVTLRLYILNSTKTRRSGFKTTWGTWGRNFIKTEVPGPWDLDTNFTVVKLLKTLRNPQKEGDNTTYSRPDKCKYH